jgi:probable F420-dependent oxidoreductase
VRVNAEPPHPFRFGVGAGVAPSRRAWRQFARKVEDLGFSTLCVSDHFNDQLAPLPALAAAAEATNTLRVGTLVLCNDYKHPVVHAKELATIDLLSDGRLEWGMGAGWFPPDYETSGIPFDRPGVRVDRLTEAVTIMKGLFGDEKVSVDGAHYRITDLDGTPKPVQRPHPPLLIGASQRRLLSFAAREADIVGIGPSLDGRSLPSRPAPMTPAAATDRQLEWIRTAAGDRFDELELQVVAFPFAVGGDVEQQASGIGASLGLEPADVLDSPHVVLGSVDAICDALEERRARWGVSYWVVPEAALDAAAPVVERLAGA